MWQVANVRRKNKFHRLSWCWCWAAKIFRLSVHHTQKINNINCWLMDFPFKFFSLIFNAFSLSTKQLVACMLLIYCMCKWKKQKSYNWMLLKCIKAKISSPGRRLPDNGATVSWNGKAKEINSIFCVAL